jgi:DNA (cytosine-5)-methyltransferase 1
MPITVVDFFSGCGGTSLGLRGAGMKIAAGIDNDPDSAGTFRLNFPEAEFVEKDIRKVATGEIRQVMPHEGKVLFSGCAPCQPFSKQNRLRRGDDPRRELLGEFQRFVVELLPDYVLVENVPGMQNVSGDGVFHEFVKTLKKRKNGYKVTWGVLPALSFGVPQTRKRLVLLASRSGSLSLPEPTHSTGGLPTATVRDYISDLPALHAGETDAEDSDHAAMDLSALNLRRIAATAEGGGRETWSADLQLDCHKGHAGHSDVYGRLAWDRPASAITTRCLSYSNGRFGHPEQDRALSLREAACLQTFPRSFRFAGSLLSKGRQVGNAVPPLMAKAIGQAIMGEAGGVVR